MTNDEIKDIDKNLIAGHEYDGIKELDNPLPGWWLVTFFATIIFGFIYWLHYDISQTGPSTSAELAADMKTWESKQAQTKSNTPTLSEEELLLLVKDAGAVNAGAAEFTAKCSSCHGQKAEGLIGPNLTDNFWIHGKGSVSDILQVAKTGVTEKGMPAWEGLIAQDVLPKVAAYIYSLKGTNPPRAKAPEGTEIKE